MREPSDACRPWSWRRLQAGEVDHERLWGALFLLGVGLAVAIPEPIRFGLRCPIKTLAGIPCLTCGSNRALSALLRLDLGAALRTNPLVTLIVVGWSLYAVYAAVVVVGRLPRLRIGGSWRPPRLALVALAVVVAAGNWLYLLAARI